MEWLDRLFDFDGNQQLSCAETFFEAFTIGLVAILVVAFMRIANLWLIN
jgi:hypothetical protein